MSTTSPELIKKQNEAILASMEKGVSMNKACQAAGINPSTFWRRRQEDEQLDGAYESVRESRIQVVEDAMFESAIGSVTVTEKHKRIKKGKDLKGEDIFDLILVERERKTAAASVTAQIFLLCNWAKERYRNVYDIEHSMGEGRSFADFTKKIAGFLKENKHDGQKAESTGSHGKEEAKVSE